MALNSKRCTHLLLTAAVAFTPIASPAATAPSGPQNYPQRPVRVIVNVSPGGGVDNVARIVSQHNHAAWGQPFVVDNRTGAGGSIGVELVVKAAPDGYTLLVASSGIVTNAAVRPGGYDPVRDLQPVTMLVRGRQLGSRFSDFRAAAGESGPVEGDCRHEREAQQAAAGVPHGGGERYARL